MQINKTFPLLAITLSLLWAQPAKAGIPIPQLNTITPMCQIISGANHTVNIDTPRDPLWAVKGQTWKLEFGFTNTVTHQTLTFQKRIASVASVFTFPLPQGNYDLTIAYINWNGGFVAETAQLQYKNITVPHFVSTNGRGTGCAFQ